ncbi:hypothetical protein C5167_029856 [Papaver somniferum]|nr:hypothetical protein C5167_029856 [Papaver somniferum]
MPKVVIIDSYLYVVVESERRLRMIQEGRVTNHTGVLFKKLIWGFELFLHEGDMIPALASAEPKLHPAKDEHRDIFKYYTEAELKNFLKFLYRENLARENWDVELCAKGVKHALARTLRTPNSIGVNPLRYNHQCYWRSCYQWFLFFGTLSSNDHSHSVISNSNTLSRFHISYSRLNT